MYCSKCGSQIIDSNDKFCKNCGNPVNVNVEVVNNASTDDEELLRIFVGKNYDKLKYQKFNLCMFFFGICYTLYRKMWLLSLIMYGISMAVNIILPELSFIAMLGVNIYLAIKWKDIYIKHCRDKIEELKQTNPNLNKEQFIALLAKKGGTTIVPVIVFVVLYILLFGLIVLFWAILVGGLIGGIGSIGDINIPSDFTQSLSIVINQIFKI